MPFSLSITWCFEDCELEEWMLWVRLRNRWKNSSPNEQSWPSSKRCAEELVSIQTFPVTKTCAGQAVAAACSVEKEWFFRHNHREFPGDSNNMEQLEWEANRYIMPNLDLEFRINLGHSRRDWQSCAMSLRRFTAEFRWTVGWCWMGFLWFLALSELCQSFNSHSIDFS